MAETIYVRGEGGAVVAMDLPLPEPIADRLASGQLVQVDADDTVTRAPARALGRASGVAHHPDQDAPARPSKAAPKADWQEWARAVHGITEERTKADLAALPDEPEQDEEPQPVPAGDGRPAEDAPKSEWVEYAFRAGKGTREDLAVYTRDDLIELTA